MAINMATAKTLCTANELSLVKASGKQQLPTLSEKQLKQKIARARKLRDKWRDQATRQRRTKQRAQAARTTSAAARSKEKTALFNEVLARFETQLAKAQHESGPQVPAKKTAKKTAKAKKPRAVASEEKAAATTKKKSSTSAKKAGRKVAKKAAKRAAASSTARPPLDPLAPTERSRQLRVQTKAKKARIGQSGMKTRIRGHVSARGKRTQARRDRRS